MVTSSALRHRGNASRSTTSRGLRGVPPWRMLAHSVAWRRPRSFWIVVPTLTVSRDRGLHRAIPALRVEKRSPYRHVGRR